MTGRRPPGAGLRPVDVVYPAQGRTGSDVLIVDDEPAIRGLARLTLTRLGLHCDEAANGILALKSVANHAYDVKLRVAQNVVTVLLEIPSEGELTV